MEDWPSSSATRARRDAAAQISDRFHGSGLLEQPERQDFLYKSGSRRRMTAKYLLRFDDLCPTMNWDVWSEVDGILRDADVKPILAVVPDNRDEKLQCGEPNSHFWEHVRQ